MKKKTFLMRVGLGVILISTGCGPAIAQGLLDRLLPRPGAEPTESARTTQAPSTAYIGLVGDDRGTGGRGVRILTIRPGSPAEKAGLQTGDLITGIGNQALRTVADMVSILSGTRPGESLDFTVERDGRRQLMAVVPTLRPPPGETSSPALPPETLPPPRTTPDPFPPAAAETNGEVYLGIRVTALDPNTRRDVPLLVRRGVVIQTVDFGSPAERAGLPVGGVIVAIDGRRVGSAEDVVAVMSTARPGQEVEIMYYDQRVAQRKRVTLASGTGADRSSPAAPASDLPSLVPPAGDSADAGALPPPADRSPLGGILRGGDLPPAVREVERVLEGILRPGDSPPAAATEDAATLRAEVATLKQRVRLLEQRLAEMERQLGAGGTPP